MVSIDPEQSTQENNTTTSQNTQTTEDSQYKLVNRVLNYPTVSNALETAKGYYEAAKDSSSLVKSVSETVESNISSTMKSLQPVFWTTSRSSSLFFLLSIRWA